MSLFKKKPEKTALIYVLDNKLKTAHEKKESYFYYPLWDKEVKMAASWATHNHILMEKDHQTDGNIYYKFYGIR